MQYEAVYRSVWVSALTMKPDFRTETFEAASDEEAKNRAIEVAYKSLMNHLSKGAVQLIRLTKIEEDKKTNIALC